MTSVDIDDFAATIESLFGNLNASVEKEALKAVRKSVQHGRKEVKSNARAVIKNGNHNHLHYVDSWRTRTKQTSEGPVGVIYSEKPGLPHLLEKGHATIGGGRVAGRKHIAPAAEDTFDKAEQLFSNYIERALRETDI